MTDEKINILAVITARGGSKGIPRKNIRDVAGKPLISYAINAALGTGPLLYKTIVSTDNDEIARVAGEYGADVPFIRPADLATDTATSLSVVQHAVREIENQDNVTIDWSLLIQPTNPMIKSVDISRAIALIDDTATSIVSVTESGKYHPLKALEIVDGYLQPFNKAAPATVRRQDLPLSYKRNGAFYMTRRDILLEHNDLYGSLVKPCFFEEKKDIDIDTEFDLKLADFILRNT